MCISGSFIYPKLSSKCYDDKVDAIVDKVANFTISACDVTLTKIVCVNERCSLYRSGGATIECTRCHQEEYTAKCNEQEFRKQKKEKCWDIVGFSALAMALCWIGSVLIGLIWFPMTMSYCWYFCTKAKYSGIKQVI
jgi:hypothetical protein